MAGSRVLIDAGYPGYRRHVEELLRELGSPLRSVAAVIVTHHHVDHAGTAEHLRSHAGATVYVHESAAPIVQGERRSHVPPGFYGQAWRPSMARYLAHTVRVGGARYRPVGNLEVLGTDRVSTYPAARG